MTVYVRIAFNSFVCLIVCFNFNCCDAVSCRDENGKQVDWFVVYKIPKLEKNLPPYNTGYSYVYVSSNNATAWSLSRKLVTQADSMFANTLSPFYPTSGTVDSKLSYIIYNDQPPDAKSSSSSYAHAKGIVGMDRDTGFWLIHSMPKFPPVVAPRVAYLYPPNAKENGQSAICLSFSTANEGDNIAYQLLTMKPKLYSSFLSDHVKAVASHFNDVIQKKWLKAASRHVPIATLNNIQFQSFAKNPTANSDIYESLIAPVLNTNLFVETWRKGAGHPLPSECDQPYHVNNIERVTISTLNQVAPVDWQYTEDHAKWAVSDTQANPFICIGDINRMASQFKRGGGSLCVKSRNLWQILHSSIEQVEACPKNVTRPNAAAGKKSRMATFLGFVTFVLGLF